MIDATFRFNDGLRSALHGRSGRVVEDQPPTIVLVHDAWSDVSSWSRVIPLLHADGLSVLAVRAPLTSLDADVAATRRVIERAQGPVILVGHGWAGTVITQAGDHPNVTGLVYIAALAPDVGECGGELVASYPRPPALSTVTLDSAGYVYQTQQGVCENLVPGLPLAQSLTIAATQGPLAPQAIAQKVTAAAWRTRPCWFLVSTEDRVISPDLEAASARRVAAVTTTLQAGHGCLLSHPSDVAAVIGDAADRLARPQLRRKMS